MRTAMAAVHDGASFENRPNVITPLVEVNGATVAAVPTCSGAARA